jgi:hypothetical protein
LHPLSIRYWAAIATALATAALVDCSSELLANAGWLGGVAAHDAHQEAVLPVALLAALVVFGLLFAVALCAGRGDRLRYNDWPAGRRTVTALATVAATFAVILLMEAYEMRYGELSALDPRSVFVEHFQAVLIGYAFVATIVGRLVSFALGAAAAAGRLAAHVLVAFLCIDRSDCAEASCDGHAFGTEIVHRPLLLALGAIGLRAPPVRQLFHLQQLPT